MLVSKYSKYSAVCMPVKTGLLTLRTSHLSLCVRLYMMQIAEVKIQHL